MLLSKLLSRFATLSMVVTLVSLTGCQNGNLFGKLHDSGDSNSVAVLQSDASIALDKKDYAGALALYERILAQNPQNAIALSGAVSAAVAGAGLDFGVIIANIAKNSASAPALAGVGEVFSQSRQGYSAQNATTDSILAGIDLGRLDDVLDVAICRMRRVVAGATDGSIKPFEASATIDLALLCLTRAITRPIRANFFDIENVNGHYTLVQKQDFDTFCGNPANAGVVTASAADLVGAYAAINNAAIKLGLQTNSTLARVKQDIDDITVELLDNDDHGDLPDDCRLLIESAGITAANFRDHTEILQAPTTGC